MDELIRLNLGCGKKLLDGYVNIDLRQTNPDVVIMDIAMPAIDGIEATKRIKKMCIDTSVLILTVLDDEEFIASSIEVGASGYLLKNVRANELIQAVRDVYSKCPTSSGSIAWRALEYFGEFNAREVVK